MSIIASPVVLLLVLLPGLFRPAAGQDRVIADPVRSFVSGFDPAGEDFFARPDTATFLLRMRLDMDGDHRTDLALSESSVFGGGGGPWLLFRRLCAGGYRYLGEIFAPPGALRVETGDSGGSELVAGSSLAADLTRLVRYRVGADTIVMLSERETSIGPGPSPAARVDSCRLVDYRRDASRCWHPGWTGD